ncbi:MAG TPA: hypothetical protein VFM82_04440 [Flavobacteriaceae bacterium]|nr:hypothetical protein [Flavobacteriaceae bacterium]
MTTKPIMLASALFLGISGIMLTFLPNEILGFLNLQSDRKLQLILQILGALYFGFAMLNWMTKESRIGGIYNRPIVVSNFAHFLIAALALVKAVFSAPELPQFFLLLTLAYVIFASLFGILLFRNPKE